MVSIKKIKIEFRNKVLDLYDSGVDLDQICFRTNLRKKDILKIIKKYRIPKELCRELKKTIDKIEKR